MPVVIKKSTRKHKKYMVLAPKSMTWIHFGDTRYQQFKDTKARHKKITNMKGEAVYKDIQSPAYWSYNYLW